MPDKEFIQSSAGFVTPQGREEAARVFKGERGEAYDPRSRFGLYRLCDCTTCSGTGKIRDPKYSSMLGLGTLTGRCPECRGEGKVRQEVASCESPEAVGVALVTLGREQEFEGCAFGLLDREGEKGQKWLILPWLPSPRNVSDAGKLLRSRRNP